MFKIKRKSGERTVKGGVSHLKDPEVPEKKEQSVEKSKTPRGTWRGKKG